ncbi:MAG TPA: Ger(x)C family spore germination protein [Syntrophomonadaceae bacterium]|nr:Ger(x)C family spore germination protein [Syntrophomonadaceae bacterium]HPU48983.1 Ger(x)C family spore germination protein [Syntrophomonadaceae bacterium]
MRNCFLGMIMLTLLLVNGCGNMIDVEQTAIGAGLGVDLDDQGKIVFFAQFNRPINIQESGISKAQSDIFVGTGKTPTQAARDIILTIPRMPLWSHSDVFVLGETLSRTDLAYMADFLARNRNIRKDALIMLAYQATPYEVFLAESPMALSSRGLVDLLRIQEERFGIYTPVSCNEFLAKLAEPGVDPVIPQVTVAYRDDRPLITLDGMAVFRQNRLVGSLNELESRGYRWLNSNKKMGGLLVLDNPLPGLNYVTLEVNRFSSYTRPRLEGNSLIMDIEVKALLNLYDQGGLIDVQSVENIEELEILAAREIERQVRACINKAQQLNGDILGWGQKVYRYYPQVWTTLENSWYEIFPQVSARVNVQTEIRKQGQLSMPLTLRR